MSFFKLSIIIPILIMVLAMPILVSGNALAINEASKDAACDGLGLVGEDCDEGDPEGEINNLIANIVNIFSWIVGVVAVIMIIISGFKYITAHGDSNAITSAKSTLTYAVVGLVIAVTAQLLVQFVLKQATSNPSPAPQGGSAVFES